MKPLGRIAIAIFAVFALCLIGSFVLLWDILVGKQMMPSDELDRAGRSTLHYVARDGDVEEIKRLIRNGANVNLADKNGCTPLHFAALEQQYEAAKALLEAGAEIDAKDKNGKTPLGHAVTHSRGRGEVIRLLRLKGADPFAKNNYGVSPIELARQIANYDVAQFFEDLPK